MPNATTADESADAAKRPHAAKSGLNGASHPSEKAAGAEQKADGAGNHPADGTEKPSVEGETTANGGAEADGEAASAAAGGGGSGAESSAEAKGPTARVGAYGSSGGRLVYFRRDRSGKHEDEIPLTNFDGRITADLELDDGSGEAIRHFKLKVTMQGGRVVDLNVPAVDFAAMRWVDQRLGAKAIVYPTGFSQAPIALKELSVLDGLRSERAVAHLGYAKHGKGTVFVSTDAVLAPSAVDTTGLVLDLPSAAAGFALPPAPTGHDLADALDAAAALLDLGPLAITLPLFLFAHRAALPVAPPNYVLWLHGLTGTYKSAVGGVFQAFFGKGWSGTKLPGNFLSTTTSIENIVHVGKNVLITLDDAQSDDPKSRQDVLRVIGRLVRGVGNQTSRHRSTSDLRQRPARDPRGAVLVTSEQLPPGHSAAARLLLVHMTKGAIDVAKLTDAQRDAADGLLAAAMSAFISDTLGQDAGRVGRVADWFTKVAVHHRATAAGLLGSPSGAHARTPDIVADLLAAAEVVLGVYKRLGVALPFDLTLAGTVLADAGIAQAGELSTADPVTTFRGALGELLSTGKVRIADKGTGAQPQDVDGRMWGWVAGAAHTTPTIGYAEVERAFLLGETVDRVYLRPGLVWSAVRDFLTKRGIDLGMGERSLWRSLADSGLVARGADAATKTVWVAGAPLRVLDCSVEILDSSDEVTAEISVPVAAPPDLPSGIL
jgi:hypothetical protein